MTRIGNLKIRAAVVAALWTGALLVPAVDSGAASLSTERINLKPSGGQSKPGVTGLHPSVSKDGDRVVFSSKASDIVGSDKDRGGYGHVFMRDLSEDKNRLVSTSSRGVPGNGPSYYPLISGNGRFVVFTSEATNLVPDDDNGLPDIFLKFLRSDKTMLVSDRRGASRASGNGASEIAAGINDRGDGIVFWSLATNLGPFEDSNNANDVFYWQRYVDDGVQKTRTMLLSHRGADKYVAGNGASGGVIGGGDVGGATISGDGTCAAFGSVATDLIAGAVDANGQYPDIFRACRLRSFSVPTLQLVSRNTSGEQGNFASMYPSFDEYAANLAYFSTSTNLVANDGNNGGDIFLAAVNDTAKPSILEIVNVDQSGNQDFGGARPLGGNALSDDGKRVAFATFGRLAPPTAGCGGEQVYLRDMTLHQTVLISVMTNGKCGDQFSGYAAISGNGEWVVWQGAATKLVPYDTNNVIDDFIRGPFG